jgi:hypothetical protein
MMPVLAVLGLIALVVILAAVAIRETHMVEVEQPTHYVLIRPWAVYVKEADFFKQQGGHEQPWGKRWRGIRAGSIEEARKIGERMRGDASAEE